MRTEVLIIGAGPYGVSLAYDLHCRGIPHQIFGHPFSLWFKHVLPEGHLRSDWRASQLYSRDGRLDLSHYLRCHFDLSKRRTLCQGRVPAPLFHDYLRWVLATLPISINEERILSLEKTSGGFVAQSTGGITIHARSVVIATGIESHRHLPPVLESLPPSLCIHSWEVSRYLALQGERLLIVGGGQSAGEAIDLLGENNSVTWVHRSPLIFFSEPINLPKPLFDLALRLSTGFYYLPDKLRERLGRRFVETTITPDLKRRLLSGRIDRHRADASQLGLQLVGDAVVSSLLERSFDRIIACTGYRYSLETLGFLSQKLLADIALRKGRPLLHRDFTTTVPRLYMIGGIAEPSHGPAQRFMFGCSSATRRVGDSLALP